MITMFKCTKIKQKKPQMAIVMVWYLKCVVTPWLKSLKCWGCGLLVAMAMDWSLCGTQDTKTSYNIEFVTSNGPKQM